MSRCISKQDMHIIATLFFSPLLKFDHWNKFFILFKLPELAIIWLLTKSSTSRKESDHKTKEKNSKN